MELQAIPASHDDYAEYLIFFKELNLAWPALPCDRWCENLAFTFFICKGSKRVGYAMYEVYSATGFIRHLAVHPDHRRQGVGKALLTSIASQLSSHGCTEWRLNVFQDNQAALALYMSRGLFIDHSAITYQLSWADIRQVQDPMVELGVHCGPLNSKDDKNIEAEYKLLSGQLQRLRSSQGSFVFIAQEYGPNNEIDGEFKMYAPLCGADLNQTSFRGKGFLCFYKNQCNPFFAGSTLIATSLLSLLKRSVGVNQQSEGFHIRILGDCDLHAYVVGLGGKIDDKTYQLKGNLPPMEN